MAGLDPAIHVFDRTSNRPAYDVDPRVKPGDDDLRLCVLEDAAPAFV